MQAPEDDRADEPALGVWRHPSLLPEAEKSLLHRVVRQVLAVQDPPRQALQAGQPGVDDLGELILPGTAAPVLAIGRRVSTSGGRLPVHVAYKHNRNH